MLKEFDIQRFAKPEIDLMSQVTGSSQLPPGVLNNILANVDATADYTIKRRGLAGQALGYDPSNPLNFPDYQQQDNALQGQYQGNADKLRQSYSAIGSTPPASDCNDGPDDGAGESIRGFLGRALARLRRGLTSGCAAQPDVGAAKLRPAGYEERPVGASAAGAVRCRSTSP